MIVRLKHVLRRTILRFLGWVYGEPQDAASQGVSEQKERIEEREREQATVDARIHASISFNAPKESFSDLFDFGDDSEDGDDESQG